MTVALLLALAPALASPHHARWDVADGLPVDGVSDVAVARDGRVWVATWDGLVRWDGARLVAVAPEGPWPSRRVVQVREAPDGAMWAQVEPGALVRIDAGDQLTVFPLGRLGSAAQMALDAEGRWLVATEAGLMRLDSQRAEKVGAGPVWDLAGDGQGRVWAIRGDGEIARWEGDQLVTAGPTIPGARMVHPVGDTLWLGGEAGVWRVRAGQVEALTAGDQPWTPEVRNLQPDGDGLWVGTKEGLAWWEDGSVRLFPGDARAPRLGFSASGARGRRWVAGGQVVVHDGQPVFRLGAGRIADLEVDGAGAVWLGTTDGLHRLLPPRIQVLAPDLAEPSVVALEVDAAGAWWVGTTAVGVDRIDATGTVHLGPESGVTSDTSAFLGARDGSFWLGTRTGVLRQDGDRFVPAGGPNTPIGALFQASDGSLYAGADDGLWRWDGRGWTRPPGTPSAVRVIVEDGPTLWLGTNGEGVWRLDGGSPRQVPVGSMQVRAILPDRRGGAWIATEDAGIRHTDGRGLGAADGLPARGVHTLIRDAGGAVWGSTNRGLFRIDDLDATEPQIGVFAETDGLLEPEANGGTGHAARALPDGRLLFATQTGIAVVDPAVIEETRRVPTVVAGGIHTGDSTLPAFGRVVLQPEQRSFAVDLGVVGLRDPERARLEWRLDGLDGDWVRGLDRRTAYYTAVPPGTYTLLARAVAADGTRGNQDLRLTLEVLPWFWETWPFRGGVALFAALALAGGVGGAAWWRVRALRRRQAELEELVEVRTAALAAEKLALEAAKETVSTQAARLAEVDRLKTRYFANLSHELRTPLTLLLGPLEDVREGRRGAIAPEAREAVTRAERSAKGLFGLVNQLLDVVKIDAGQLRLRREPLDLVGLVRALVADFAPLADRQGLVLRSELPEGPIPVDLDPREFPKVVGNLLSNAVKFTPRGGTIAVRVRADGDHAELEVRDTGPGISPEGLQRIFDRFYMVDGVESGLQPGTGLGLALSREIVELHGGALSVESEPGRGSTFRVRLSTTTATPEPHLPELPALDLPMIATTAAPEERPDERTVVLVADDHADLRRYIAECLEPRYRVVEAGDGLEALQVARRALPDLVVSDVMMPGMDGNDLVRALRADPELGAVPIILLTARSGADAQIEGLRRGADVFLTKPFSSAVLRAQVDGLVALRGRAPAAEPPVEVLSADARYEQAIREMIAERHVDPNFGVQELADAMHQDRAHLFRRVKALTGEAPSDLIRVARLEHAARLLAQRQGNVSEVAYAAGFASLSYFSHAFREHFGVAPSKYAGKGKERRGEG